MRSKTIRPLLIPAPRRAKWAGGMFTLPRKMFLMLQDHAATRDWFGAERFVLEAEELTPCDFELAAGDGADATTEIRVRFAANGGGGAPEKVGDQAYKLKISAAGIEIQSGGAPGTFYGLQTLLQIMRWTGKQPRAGRSRSANKVSSLPCCEIADWPDFERRGVYHDTARGKVPKLETLLQLVDDLARLKINEFQLYVENNFDFRRHPEMHDDTHPLTAEELLTLDAACRARHMDFVPSLTSLGHFEKILSRPAFRHLAEAEPAQLKAIGATCWHEAGPWSLCVTDPAARALLKDMYEEFVPQFSSGMFNICCDEAYDLGVVRSKEYAEKMGGTGPLYVEWINYCAGLARGFGKSIQMWGDIILKYPELIGALPEDAVLLEWGYEHDHKFEEHCATFAQRIRNEPKGGRQAFYVSPGTSSWLALAGRSKNAFGNIHAAAAAGVRHGAEGILVTDWGDSGHQQMLAVSMISFAYGAAAGWNLEATVNPVKKSAAGNRALTDLLAAMSLHVFQEVTPQSGGIAGLAYELGLCYELFGWQRFNASVDWFLFREKWDFANYVNRVEEKDLRKVIAACVKLKRAFECSTIDHLEGPELLAEFAFTCDEVAHVCRRTALRKAWLAADPAARNPEEPTKRGKPPKPLPASFTKEMAALKKEANLLRKQFEKLWLARNKRSRVADVSAEFQRLEKEYATFT